MIKPHRLMRDRVTDITADSRTVAPRPAFSMGRVTLNSRGVCPPRPHRRFAVGLERPLAA